MGNDVFFWNIFIALSITDVKKGNSRFLHAGHFSVEQI